eukprot:02907.XXX_1098_61101_1 [CDS] Oithona nana genome sequencing.
MWKPKNPHSLEHLKYLYSVLYKNQTVTESNKSLLVETLRSIAEILIWGDQNDSTVFDFFLERNMLSFFLKIMNQKCGSYVCVQLLQTLNILFENIRNETSIYYLLSNNHVNSIIVHKFDFSDEEVMAYYISFLKTLSFRLNKHTIHFFYNEHTNDFPLYTEAIKFFNHSESMVRIAVRTLSLNVYKVEDESMLRFVIDKTAVPYFANLVWFIGNHILEIDACVRNDADHRSLGRLKDLVAEHLDHVHYLNDILCLRIDNLNEVLTGHLLNRLFIPLYIYSLVRSPNKNNNKKIQRCRSASSLSSRLKKRCIFWSTNVQVFFESTQNTPFEFSRQKSTFQSLIFTVTSKCTCRMPFLWENKNDIPAKTSIDEHLLYEAEEKTPEKMVSNKRWTEKPTNRDALQETPEPQLQNIAGAAAVSSNSFASLSKLTGLAAGQEPTDTSIFEGKILGKSIITFFYNGKNCLENDYLALFNFCLLRAIQINEDDKIRLVTLDASIDLLKGMVLSGEGKSFLADTHFAQLEGIKEESTLLLRNFYKSEEIFLDMFEDEYRAACRPPPKVEFVLSDASLLLPPTVTPLTGIDFTKRLPCGEVERARRSIRTFFRLRQLSLEIQNRPETKLPLSSPDSCIQVQDVLDLNQNPNFYVVNLKRTERSVFNFLCVFVSTRIPKPPNSGHLNYLFLTFRNFFDLEVVTDKEDSRCLHVTVHSPRSSSSSFGSSPAHVPASRNMPLLSATFTFDDHIRCMAAKQRLTKGRIKARQRKMHQIAKLLELPGSVGPSCPSPPTNNLSSMRDSQTFCKLLTLDRQQKNISTFFRPTGGSYRPLFNASSKVPGAAALLREAS